LESNMHIDTCTTDFGERTNHEIRRLTDLVTQLRTESNNKE